MSKMSELHAICAEYGIPTDAPDALARALAIVTETDPEGD